MDTKPFVGMILENAAHQIGTVISLADEAQDWGGNFAVVEYISEDVYAPIDQRPARSTLTDRWHYTTQPDRWWPHGSRRIRTHVIDRYNLARSKQRHANTEIINMFGGPDIQRDEAPDLYDMRRESTIEIHALETAMNPEEYEQVMA